MIIKKSVLIKDLNCSKYNPKQDGITASLLSDYLMCRQKFLIGINLYRPAEQRNFFYGSLFHGLLDIAYQSRGIFNIQKQIDFLTDELREQTIGMKEEEVEKHRCVAKIMMEGYLKKHKKDFIRFKNPEVEKIFNVRFEGYRLRGKIDLRCMPLLMEHKNYSHISEDILKDVLLINLQNLFYITATEIEKRELVKEFYYNINRVPMYKVGKEENFRDFLKRFEKEVKNKPDHFFIRIPLVFTEQAKNHFKKELLLMLNEVDDLCKTDGCLTVYRNYTACEGRKYNCGYIKSCACGKLIACKKKDKLFTELEEK